MDKKLLEEMPNGNFQEAFYTYAVDGFLELEGKGWGTIWTGNTKA